MLHGDGRNRWYDKAMQFIVFANGKAGMLGEHSMSDGMPSATVVDWMLTQYVVAPMPLESVPPPNGALLLAELRAASWSQQAPRPRSP